MRTSLLLFLIFISAADSFCQNRNSVWCFGDSAGIDFSDTANIITGTSSVKSRGSCATICDTAGQLLFYTSYDVDTWTIAGPPFMNGEVFNKLHNTMDNGDSIVMQGWYHEAVIVDNPSNVNQYYVFSIGVTGSPQQGLYYSIIDMSLNGGLGEVIQKNIQLQSFMMVDCLTAIKHGNGRDWWVLFRKWNNPVVPNNKFYSYLITPTGITNYTVQNIGSTQSTGFGNIVFNNEGTKMIYLNIQGLLEYYDFDRCTGLLANPVTIFPEQTFPFSRLFWGGEFSSSGDLFYTTTIPVNQPDTSRLLQFDLTAPNIAASADTLRETMFMETQDDLKLAPDGKIYLATSYYQTYPYADATYNNINMHLSTINSPDSLGAACDLQLYSFYLGGSRTYGGLPNNPDYELGAVTGSVCDTLTSLTPALSKGEGAELFVYYHPAWQKAFINAKGLKGSTVKMSVYDVLGNVVYRQQGGLSPSGVGGSGGYFTKDLNMAAFAKGMYIVDLSTEKERLVKKFVKE